MYSNSSFPPKPSNTHYCNHHFHKGRCLKLPEKKLPIVQRISLPEVGTKPRLLVCCSLFGKTKLQRFCQTLQKYLWLNIKWIWRPSFAATLDIWFMSIAAWIYFIYKIVCRRLVIFSGWQAIWRDSSIENKITFKLNFACIEHSILQTLTDSQYKMNHLSNERLRKTRCRPKIPVRKASTICTKHL